MRSRGGSSAFHFLFSPAHRLHLLGGLQNGFSLLKGSGCSQALAGTIQRGVNDDEDKAFEQALVNSAKDFQEHQYVVEFLQSQLEALCESYQADGALTVLKLPLIQHLLMAFEGVLKPNVKLASVLQNCIPTPAVGGVPTRAC